MARANFLVEVEDEMDENNLYVNFYVANRPFLKKFLLHQIPYYLKRKIAAHFYRTGLTGFKDEWIWLLEELGVDETTISDIDFESNTLGKYPICLAINGILRSNNTSLGDFIDVLCKIGKFHILRLLKPFAEDLLKKKNSLNEEQYYSGPLPSAPNCSSLEVTCSLFDSCDSGVNYSTPQGTGHGLISCQEIKERQTKDHKTDFELFQNSEAISFGNNKQLYAVSNSLNINQSDDKIISVFIMHSMLDKQYAKKLAKYLKKKNFRVITSANIYHYLRENPSMIMKVVDEQVDFVVPVMSESLMNQIKFTAHKSTEEKDIESVANTFLYDRLLNEYTLHNFFNYRVRPVCFLKGIRKHYKLDQILSWSAYVPYTDLGNDEVLESEFLRHLRFSKQRL